MKSTEDFSLELNIFNWNVNYKRLETLVQIHTVRNHTMPYFKNVQPRIDVIISHQALEMQARRRAGNLKS